MDESSRGLSVLLTWFSPSRGSSPPIALADVGALRAALPPYSNHERLVVCLDKDAGETGSVWVHLSADRAWVTHFTQLGGADSYARDESYRGDEMVGFLLDNGQLDEIHRYWTVTRSQGLQALAYFAQHGQRDPGLSWVQEPASLQERG
jgi:hypothetical protein